MFGHIHLLVATIGAAAVVALCGCTLARLGAEAREYESSTVLVGRVELGTEAEGTIVVGAYAGAPGRWQLVHQTLLHEHGGFELIVPAGQYALFAFADRNGNGLFDAGEPAASRGTVQQLQTGDSGMVAGLDMTLGDGTPQVPRLQAAPRHSTQAGALASLDAPAFAAESGSQGYWQPMSFFRAQGGNVYFLEPYDAGKTPVLFVHGAVGSPQDWRHQIGQLDRSRFQPWVFFYPSGSSVASMSNLLYWKLLNLQLRHRYEHLVIVAHSMGGLVVRRFLLDNGANLPQIRRFISLSTPWAGEVSADSGVKLSPAVVPSWRDMQPDGPFMRSLFDRRLPATVEYDLLFGHRGTPGLWRPNNDGTVTLASQLRRAAQEEAGLVFGYDEDHTSILNSAQVTRQLHGLLSDSVKAPSGSRLDVRLAHEGTAPQGLPLLVLLPQDPPGSPITVALSAADGGGRVTALPPGRYEAGVLAVGHVAEPRRQSVTLGAQETTTLAFRLRAQGQLGGYVVQAQARPAGSHPALNAAPEVRSVSLRGAGVQRVLQAEAADPGAASALRRLLDGRDHAWGPVFSFVDLPEGEYELEIVARGHATHRSRHAVVPGFAAPLAPITLQPLR